jgi:hypothetical protein
MKKALLENLTNLAGLAGLFLILVFPFAAVVYQLVTEFDRKIEFTQQKRRGLEYNHALRKLLEYLLVHQDRAKVYLSGNSTYKSRFLAAKPKSSAKFKQ